MIFWNLGDSVIADRGFVNEDLLREGVSLNISPFLDGREHFEPRKLAHARLLPFASMWSVLSKG